MLTVTVHTFEVYLFIIKEYEHTAQLNENMHTGQGLFSPFSKGWHTLADKMDISTPFGEYLV